MIANDHQSLSFIYLYLSLCISRSEKYHCHAVSAQIPRCRKKTQHVQNLDVWITTSQVEPTQEPQLGSTLRRRCFPASRKCWPKQRDRWLHRQHEALLPRACLLGGPKGTGMHRITWESRVAAMFTLGEGHGHACHCNQNHLTRLTSDRVRMLGPHPPTSFR